MELGGSPFLTSVDQAFRAEMRQFFRACVPEGIRRKVSAGQPLAKEDIVTSQRILNARGLAVPHWPVAWGGRDWTAVQRYVYTEELQFNAVPLPLQFNCFMIGPVIAAFGSDEQKQRFLARIANLDDWWCQGFSEPDAGSDLASLKTRAERIDGHYFVNGQKTWTTYAQYADWMFCLLRTDSGVAKQRGISLLLIDMKTPGVEVRPITTLDGRHEVNEVFLTDVKVPAENLVGEENRGWDYAKFLLSNERSGIARIGLTKERISRIRNKAQQSGIWEDWSFRGEVIRLEVEVKALELMQMRILARAADSGNAPDPASSILKLKGSILQQRAAELLMEVEGSEALCARGNLADPHNEADEYLAAPIALTNYLNFRKVSIYGGANEIQKNIIAKTVLKL